MLGESPGAILAALYEALSAYLLMVSADGLAFGHEFIRQVHRVPHEEDPDRTVRRGAAALRMEVVTSLPDTERYIRMRQM